MRLATAWGDMSKDLPQPASLNSFGLSFIAGKDIKILQISQALCTLHWWVAWTREKWHSSLMSTETMEREIAELKQRLARVEAKVQPGPTQRWRSAVGSVKPTDLTREAARLGEEWRAAENQRR